MANTYLNRMQLSLICQTQTLISTYDFLKKIFYNTKEVHHLLFSSLNLFEVSNFPLLQLFILTIFLSQHEDLYCNPMIFCFPQVFLFFLKNSNSYLIVILLEYCKYYYQMVILSFLYFPKHCTNLFKNCFSLYFDQVSFAFTFHSQNYKFP